MSHENQSTNESFWAWLILICVAVYYIHDFGSRIKVLEYDFDVIEDAVSPLVEQVKELEDKVDDLELKIIDLESKIDDIDSRVEDIEFKLHT